MFLWEGSRATTIYFSVSSILAWRLRSDLIRDEWEARTAPALAAIDASAEINEQYPIVTLEPMVVQIYGPPSAKVVAMPLLTPDRVQALGGMLYLRQDHYQSETDRRRYAAAFAALPAEQRVIREGRGWSVLLLGAHSPRQ